MPVFRRHQRHSLPHLREARSTLRKTLTPAEALLWKCLQGRKLGGRKFQRQHSIENFVVDFYCPEERLIIELDGQHHFSPDGQAHDAQRDQRLAELGYLVLRFENERLITDLPAVLDQIQSWFGKSRQLL